MQTLRDQAARRAWTQVQGKVAQAQNPTENTPSMGEVFRQGFLHGSLLQLAVCAPGRNASTVSRTQLLVSRLESKATQAIGAVER